MVPTAHGHDDQRKPERVMQDDTRETTQDEENPVNKPQSSQETIFPPVPPPRYYFYTLPTPVHQHKTTGQPGAGTEPRAKQ